MSEGLLGMLTLQEDTWIIHVLVGSLTGAVVGHLYFHNLFRNVIDYEILHVASIFRQFLLRFSLLILVFYLLVLWHALALLSATLTLMLSRQFVIRRYGLSV